MPEIETRPAASDGILLCQKYVWKRVDDKRTYIGVHYEPGLLMCWRGRNKPLEYSKQMV